MNVQGLGHPVTPYCCNTPTFKGASGSQPPLLQPQQSPSLTTVQIFASQTIIDPDSPEMEFTRRGNFPSQGCIQGVINRIQWGRGHPTFFFLYVKMFSSLVWFLLITHQGTIKYSFRPVQPYHGRSPPFCPNNHGNNCTGCFRTEN